MRKKLLVMLMTLCMLVVLAACGNVDNTEEAEQFTETVEENEDDEDEPATNSDTAEETSEEQNEEQDESRTEEQEDGQGQSQDGSQSEEQPASNPNLIVDAEYANLQESTGFEFESNGDGTCTLTGIGDCTDSDIVIPEKSPEGDTVTMIAEDAFYRAEDISSIIFAGRTMEVDSEAFESCEAERIVITGCDMVIGEYAFSYCDDVEEVYISGSNIEVDNHAFYNTGNDLQLEIVNGSGTLNDKAFQSCAILQLIISDSTLEMDEYVFAYCEDVETVTFDNCTVEIGGHAFYDSGDDAIVTFSNCEIDMDDKAFQSSSLIKLNIVGCETVMGEYTFAYCEDLTEVIIGAGNIEIGSHSFYDCTSLVNVSIAADSEDDSLALVIDDKAFQSCSVQNVIIGRGNTEIGEYAFAYCEELVSVDIRGVLSDMEDHVFYDCPEELVILYNGENYDGESIEDAM